MVQGVAQGIGPLLLDALLDATDSYSALYLVMAALALVGVGLLAKAGRPVRPAAKGAVGR